MNYRTLGKTGFRISEVGFGAWGLGGDAYGPVDDAISKQTIQTALDRGVNFFDTADLYGGGRSEVVLGEALGPVRDQVIIATKAGTLPHSGFYMPQDFSAAHIKTAVEGSLKRLRTDRIDLYQLHSPDLETANLDEAVDALIGLRDAGKIRAYGISARSSADARQAITHFPFATAQVNFNLIDHRALDSGFFELAEYQRVGVIARTPLCFGYLTGRLTGTESVAGPDHRRNWPREQLQRWAQAPNAFASLHGERRTATQLALRFCLAFEGVSTVIPGMMTPAQALENTAASELAPLSREELEEIRGIYQAHNFYDRTIKAKALETAAVQK